MNVRVLLLLVAMLASCKREEAPAKKPPTESCFADDIDVGKLRPAWNQLQHCRTENAECRDACARGDGDACFNLAIGLESQTRGGDDDAKRVTSDFWRACMFGVALGCTNWAAGELFATKSRFTRSCLYRVFDKSCDAGESYGCAMTGRILVEWTRTPVDVWIGYSRLSNACSKIGGPPCRFLAMYIERGIFGPPDRARAKALLAQACDTGDDDACDHDTAEETLIPDD